MSISPSSLSTTRSCPYLFHLVCPFFVLSSSFFFLTSYQRHSKRQRKSNKKTKKTPRNREQRRGEREREKSQDAHGAVIKITKRWGWSLREKISISLLHLFHLPLLGSFLFLFVSLILFLSFFTSFFFVFQPFCF